jgi:hypothetical protein
MYTKEEVQEYWHKCEQAAKLLQIINSLLDDECFKKEDAAKDLKDFMSLSELQCIRINDKVVIL